VKQKNSFRPAVRAALLVVRIIIAGLFLSHGFQGKAFGMIPEETVLVGHLSIGGKVLAVSSGAGEWGIRVETPGKASVSQSQPIRLCIYESEAKIVDVSGGYKALEKTSSGFTGKGELFPLPGVAVKFEDR